jgi:hypothetical protein
MQNINVIGNDVFKVLKTMMRKKIVDPNSGFCRRKIDDDIDQKLASRPRTKPSLLPRVVRTEGKELPILVVHTHNS